MVMRGLKFIRSKTTKKPHNFLVARIKWYRMWHNFRFHKHIHISALMIYVTIILLSFFSVTPQTIYASSGSFSQTTFNGTSDGTYTNTAPANSNADTILSNFSALSNAGGDKWQYRKPVTVTNTGSALTDYQTLLDSEANVVGDWHLDENTGQTATDSSRNSRNGTLGSTAGSDTNDPTWTTGKYGQALSFDGIDNYVDFGTNLNSAVTSSGTWEFWINPTALTNDRIFGYTSSWQQDEQWLFWTGTSSVVFSMDTGAEAQSVSIAVSTGQWTHIAVVWTGSTLTMYKNGVAGTPVSISGTFDGNANPIRFGAPNTDGYNGLVDEAKIYNRALSTSEVTARYNDGGFFQKVKSDGSDIRLTDSDGTTELPYWLDSFNNSSTAKNYKIWTKIPSVPNGTKDIYKYYGNSSATSSSNGANTFDFFDDFNAASVDTNKWTVAGNVSQSGGIVTIGDGLDDDDSLNSKQSFGENKILEMNGYLDVTTLSYFKWGFSDLVAVAQKWQDQTSTQFWYFGSGSEIDTNELFTGSYHRFMLRRKGSGTADLWVDGVQKASASSGAYTGNSTVGGNSYDANKYLKADWLFVRKYASSEPTTSAGSESSAYVSSGTLTSSTINPTGLYDWGNLTFNKTTPSGTALTVDVLRNSDSTVLATNVATGTDLSSVISNSETSIKLKSNFSGDGSNTSTLSDWTIAYTYDNTGPTGTALSWGTVTSSAIDIAASDAVDLEAGLRGDNLTYYIERDNGATTFATADANSGWISGIWSQSSLSANTAYSYRVKSRDVMGNESSWVTPSPAYKYTLAVIPTLNSPTTPTTDNSPTITGSTTVNVTVKLYDDGVLKATATANGSGNFSFGDAQYSDTLSEGAHTNITAKSFNTDSIASSDSGAVSVTVDSVAPTTSATSDPASPDGTNSYFKTNPTITLSVSDPAPSGGSGTTYYKWDDAGFTSPSTYSVPIDMNSSIGQGTHTLYWRTTDTVGNQESSIKNQEFKLDTATPSVNAGADQTDNSEISQNATVTDATSGVASYTWAKQSGPGIVTFGSSTSEDTTISSDTDGTYIIRLTVTDNAGNIAYDEMTLIWDTLAPSVNAGADKNKGAEFTQNATVTEATSGIATYAWTKQTGDGVITFGTGSAEDTTVSADANGAYVIRLTVTDNAGNISYDEFNLNWDTNIPTVILSTSAANPTNVSPIPVTAEFSKDVTGFVVGDITVGNGSASNFISVDGNTYTFDITPTTDGAVTIDVASEVAQDAFGNDNSASNQLSRTYDGTDPAVSSVTSTTSNGAYNFGDPINITVNFPENITLSGGSLTITLNTGRTVSISTISNANTASATYTVQAGDSSADLTAVSPLSLSGTLRDQAGNDTILTIPGGQNIANFKAIVVDTTVPSTSITSVPSSPDGENSWFVSNPAITLIGSDDISGVSRIEYQWDGTSGSWTTYTTAINISLQGTHTLYYRAFDNATNQETNKSQQFKFDSVVPAGLSIQIGNGGDYMTSNPVTLALSASDATSGMGEMQFSNDGVIFSPFENYNTSKSWDLTNPLYGGDSSDESKTVYVKFKDNAGNQTSATSASSTLDRENPTNPSAEGQASSEDSTEITSNNWYKYSTPYFSLTGAVDITSGLEGYYVYWGNESDADPLSEGVFQTEADYSPVLNPATDSGKTYYLRVRSKDNAGNIYTNGDSSAYTTYVYKYDPTVPSVVSYVTPSPSGWNPLNSFSFSWPVATDPLVNGARSDVKGYEYKRQTDDTWAYTSETSVTGILAYQNGINVFSLKTVDNAGNYSAAVPVNYYYSGNIPAPDNLQVDISQSSNQTINNYKFTWEAPEGITPQGYYYSVNSIPTTQNSTFTSDSFTGYDAFATQQGLNTFYVVTKDEEGNVGWSNYAQTSFTCDTAAPGAPAGVLITDSSNRDSSRWQLTINWDQPSQVTDDFNGYVVERSTNGTDYTQIATTSSQTTGYLDTNLLNSTTYYYRVRTKDNTGNISATSTVVSEVPTGRYTSPPNIIGEVSMETKSTKGTAKWTTDRDADSFIQIGTSTAYGMTQGQLGGVEVHTVNISGLAPGTTYHYRAMWRDSDGNIGYSSDKTLRTTDAPAISEVKVTDITLNSAIVSWKTNTVSTSTVYYGETISYGGKLDDISGSQVTTHTIKLEKLDHTSTYNFKIGGTDTEGNALSSDNYVFSTLTFPRVSNVKYTQIKEATSATYEFTWDSNVATNSIVQYRGAGSDDTKEAVASAYVTSHKLRISNLSDNANYIIVVKGRDEHGNESSLETVNLKTDLDTRAPAISDVTVETSIIGAGKDAKGQLVVSWLTDEISTSQVEYGIGVAGDSYSSKTQEDTTLTTSHVVIISDLTASTSYHFRIISKDKAGNKAESNDNSALTEQATDSVIDIVINSLEKTVGWIFRALNW